MAEESEEDDDSKEFAPSQRRLQQAREEGDVVRSDDLQAAAAQAGFLLSILAFGAWAITALGDAGAYLLAWPDAITLMDDTAPGDSPWSSALAMIAPAMLLLIAPAAAVVVWLLASRSLVFAPSKLSIRWNRLSPVENARQKFGRAGLFDFLKRAAKMVAIGTTLVLFLIAQSDALFQSVQLGAGAVALLMTRMIVEFLLLGVALTLAFGVADYLLQRAEFLRRNRMTRKQMMDEMKDSEGDPHLKADRRRRAQEIASRRMMTEVPTADVVIVNPEHYAVALKWNRQNGRAPVCVAKGVDEIALRIRDLAAEAGVPIRRDPPTARLLHAALDVGEEIRPEHYAAVAAAIRFADAMRKRAGSKWRTQ